MSYGNGDMNCYVNFYMNNLKKAEFTTLIRHIERFSNSRIPILNSVFPKTAGKKTARSQWRIKHLSAEPRPRSYHPPKFSDHKSLMKVEIKIFQVVTWPQVVNMIKSSGGFNGGAFHGYPAPCLVSCQWVLSKWRYNVFNLPSYTWPHKTTSLGGNLNIWMLPL